MRCYEAAACGSLLFCEEENGEIREFFEDRVHCVLYNEQNLDELLDYYLSHEEERARITRAAAERVAEFSFPRNMRRLADRLEELDLPARMKVRRARSLPAPERRKGHARQVAGAMTEGALETAIGMLEQVVDRDPKDADAHNDLAVLNAQRVGRAPGRQIAGEWTARALRHMKSAIDLCPTSAFFQLNLASMYADTGWCEAALDLARQAVMLLDGEAPEPSGPFCLPFPFTWDEYRVQYSSLYCATRSAPESFEPLRRCLLAHRGGMLLGRLAEQQELLELAALGYRVAVAARPDLGGGHAALARALARGADRSARGNEVVEEALQHLETGLKTDPFLVEAWTLYADLLIQHHRPRRAREFISDRLTMLEALIPPKERFAMAEGLADLEDTRRELLRRLEAVGETTSAGGVLRSA
jgi:tetratricopeptide (TPR) repeat protein